MLEYFVGCDECSVITSMCFKDGPNCYLIFCGQNDWHGAKELCEKKGGDLPLITNQNDIMKITQAIKSRRNPCTKFWIGIFYLEKRKGKICAIKGNDNHMSK